MLLGLARIDDPFTEQFFKNNEWSFLYSLNNDFGFIGRSKLGVTNEQHAFIGQLTIEDIPNYKQLMIVWYIENQKLLRLQKQVSALKTALRDLGVI